jgi:pyruvate dehydrogenase E1 component
MVPEAIAASDLLRDDDIFVNVVNVTSAGRLYRAFQQAVGGWVRSGANPPASSWIASFSGIWEPAAPIITVLDGHPHTLAWLPSALGSAGIPLGVTDFGQSGTRSDLYRQFQIDAEAIADACLAVLLDREPATMD